MNCQDIAQILDEQEVDRLLATEHSAVQAHLATCADCARDWQIHKRLSGMEIPAVPAELRALYASRVLDTAVGGASRRGRFIVIGALVAVAAAASMLAVQLTGSRTPDVASFDPPRVESPSVVFAEHVEEVLPTATRAEATPVVASTTRAKLRVLLMPPRHDSTDMAARPGIEAFHSSLLVALRNMPDVVVDVSGGAGSDADQPVNRLIVVNPLLTILPSGQRVYQNGDGSGGWSGGRGPFSNPPWWAVEVMAEPANQERQNSGFTSSSRLALQLEVDGNGIPGGGYCGGGGIQTDSDMSTTSNGRRTVVCSSVDQIAARLVETLRQKTEPPATAMARFSSQLRDPSIQDRYRSSALSGLLESARKGGIALDAVAIGAITAYVGSLRPDQRASTWSRLHDRHVAGLEIPLLEALQHDADEKVRLEALSTLTADYGSDRRVLVAFESVARQDASRFVRMAAQRPLDGESQWQRYVAETLANKGLPARERLAPAMYGMRSVTNPADMDKSRVFLGSVEGTSQLLDIFQELRTAPRQAATDGFPGTPGPQESAMQNVISLMSRANPSAALDLQIRIVTEDPLPDSLTTRQTLVTLMRKRDDPRVSKVLDDIAAGKSGAELRTLLEGEMVLSTQR